MCLEEYDGGIFTLQIQDAADSHRIQRYYLVTSGNLYISPRANPTLVVH